MALQVTHKIYRFLEKSAKHSTKEKEIHQLLERSDAIWEADDTHPNDSSEGITNTAQTTWLCLVGTHSLSSIISNNSLDTLAYENRGMPKTCKYLTTLQFSWEEREQAASASGDTWWTSASTTTPHSVRQTQIKKNHRHSFTSIMSLIRRRQKTSPK